MSVIICVLCCVCVYDSLNRLDMLTTILFFYIPAYLSYILNNADIDFDSSTLLSEAIIGAFAGGCGAFLTNPTDIITTRIITQSVDEEDIIDEDGNIISKPPLGVIEMANKLYKEGGPAAFFVGWQARVGYWKVRLVLFYYVNSSVQYEVSVIWLFHSACFYLIAFANYIY